MAEDGTVYSAEGEVLAKAICNGHSLLWMDPYGENIPPERVLSRDVIDEVYIAKHAVMRWQMLSRTELAKVKDILTPEDMQNMPTEQMEVWPNGQLRIFVEGVVAFDILLDPASWAWMPPSIITNTSTPLPHMSC
jgi:hypothetical protein